jgi:hypothetical protein
MANIPTVCTFCDTCFACDEFLVGTQVTCPHCGRSVEVRPGGHASPPRASRISGRSVLMGGLAMSTVVAAAFFVLWVRSHLVLVAPAIRVERNPVAIGEAGYLSVARQNLVWVAVDEQSQTDWYRCSLDQNQPRLKELIKTGKGIRRAQKQSCDGS